MAKYSLGILSLRVMGRSLAQNYLVMVQAGAPVDPAVGSLKPYLEKGDLIMDGGNSFFTDTERRVKSLEAEGIDFIGMGTRKVYSIRTGKGRTPESRQLKPYQNCVERLKWLTK